MRNNPTVCLELTQTMAARPVPYISLRNFDLRKDEIAKELIDAAENVGFFVLVDQESPSKQDISDMFELS